MSLLWTLCLLVLGLARAEERVPILRVEGPMVYVPIGTDDGLRLGGTVTVYRSVAALDPRTGRTLREPFPIGSATVVWAGDTLSRLRLPAPVAMQIAAGDVVGMEPAPVPAVAPAVAAWPGGGSTPPPAPVAAAVDPVRTEVRVEMGEEAQAFQAAFTVAAGTNRATRVEVWSAWLKQWPGSPMAPAVRDEVAALRRSPSAAPGQSPLPDGVVIDVEARAPQRVPEHAPVPVVLSTSTPEELRGATLFFRLRGEETYRHEALRPIGDTAFSATIPAAATLRPGMEWFVEVRDSDDNTGPVGGTPLRPAQIAVNEVPTAPVIVNRSQARVFYEYVDFYAGSGADHYHHGEADFVYRLAIPVLYSMRLGAGTYRGLGGVTQELDQLGKDRAAQAAEPVGYNFGYTELEFKLARWLAVIGRGLVGIDNAGMAGGGEGRIRLGREEGTSLDAGAARVGRIGTRYALSLAWNSVARVPMAASIEVTDFPGVARSDGSSIDDFGVRLIYDARYQFTDHFELGGRVGWALRNVDHAGPSAGLQGVFSW